MTCSGCCAKFTLLQREKACNKCKLAFCRKCLVQSSSSSSNKNNLLCKTCARGGFASDSDSVPKTPFRENSRENHHRGGLAIAQSTSQSADQSIAVRLDKLRAPHKIATTEELERKLQSLKGTGAPTSSSSSYNFLNASTVKKTQEQVNDLIKEYAEENAISGRFLSPEEEIEQRLAKLKGEGSTMPAEVDSAEEYLKKYDPSKNVHTVEKAPENLEDINAALQKSFVEYERDAKASLSDPQVGAMLKKFSLETKHCGGEDSRKEIDEDTDESESDSELYDVIKQALLTPDDEDELNNEMKAKAVG